MKPLVLTENLLEMQISNLVQTYQIRNSGGGCQKFEFLTSPSDVSDAHSNLRGTALEKEKMKNKY